MSVKHYNVNTIEVAYRCDEPSCCLGEMLFTGNTSLSAPLTYEHKCNNKDCGKILNLTEVYPYIQHERIYPE